MVMDDMGFIFVFVFWTIYGICYLSYYCILLLISLCKFIYKEIKKHYAMKEREEERSDINEID